MKVLLTVPLPRLLPRVPFFPDLGLGILGSHLESHGHEVAVHDWNSPLSPEEFKLYIARLAPQVVGIKVFTINIPGVLGTMAIIHRACPEAQIILGGPHISATAPDEIFDDFPQAVYALQGEAELSLPQLLRYLQGDPVELDSVPGLIWQGGNAVKVNAPVREDDLDKLGRPSWGKINPRHYYSPPITRSGVGAPLAVTRGCPGVCGFCSVSRISGKKVRRRSAPSILDEIEYLVKNFGVTQLYFSDTNFLYGRDLAASVCEGILQRGLKLSWDCLSDYSWFECDPALYRLMARAGCHLMHVGIESGSDRVRRWLGQAESVQQVRDQILRIRNAGIGVQGWFLLGLPNESRDEMAQTVDLAFSLKLDDRYFTPCFPLPGTKVYAWLKERYQIPRIHWASFDPPTSPYPMSQLSSEELARLCKSLNRRSFWRPRVLGPRIVWWFHARSQKHLIARSYQ
jgi:anaerobic magnesium-protoporphyrin IX monomethyl ester cyclase